MKRLLRAVCLVLCWTLLMAGMPGRASAEEAAPMVRVLLRRLQLTDRADLTLAGAYTVRVGGEDLMALPENAQVTVQIRSGALYLFYDGMSMRLGKSAEFRRNQSSSAMPGLRFEKNGNLYPGSLMLTVENGTLVPILTLSVEDYLLGVVPYEMSDSFPLEALKAQAVCARTYALSHLNASRAYDVVDTTNDQVFKGVDSSTKNAARAVQETAGIVGMYNGKLSMDTLPYTAMLGTCSVDSIAADSANTASAYMTGHKSSVNALGVYADRTPDSLDDPKQETIAELLRRTTGKSIGVVSDAEIEDATPASVVGHTRRRADKAEIVDMFYSVKPDVIIGGGSAYFLPQNVPGSKRKDDKNYVEMFQKEGYALATSNTELSKAVKGNPDKLLGLFHTGNMDGVLDRKFLKKGTVSKFPDQPDLTDSMRAALSVLSKNPEGFFLMLEAGLVDKYSHPLDWERAVYDTIMFDKVVAIAQEFCDKNPDTLLIVTGDHTHSISVIGTVDDNLPGELMRDKVGIYAEAGYPTYKDENGDGYPDDVNVSKRLAVFIGNYPDYYETYRPKMDGPFVPSVKDEKGHYIANAAYKDVPGAQLRIGNLPRTESTGVHSIDDLVVGARGPHADAFRGFMNSTEVFRIMSEALALGNK